MHYGPFGRGGGHWYLIKEMFVFVAITVANIDLFLEKNLSTWSTICPTQGSHDVGNF